MDKRKKLILIAGFVLLSGFSALIAYGFFSGAQPKDELGQYNEIKDKATGQTIDTGDDRTPENYGRNPSQPSMIGFSALIDQGITQGALESIQNAVSDYFVSTKDYPPASEVSLSNAFCDIPNDVGTPCTANLTINQKDSLDLKADIVVDGKVTTKIIRDGKVIYENKLDKPTNQ